MVRKRDRRNGSRKGNARSVNQKPPVSPVIKPETKIILTEPDKTTADTGAISSGISKRITFTVSEELHKKAFLLTRRQGTTIKDLLTNFLEQATINEQV
jgi:hypothetical protein